MRGTNRKPQQEPARLSVPPTANTHWLDTLTRPHAHQEWHIVAAVLMQLEEGIFSFRTQCNLTFCIMAARLIWRKWPWVLLCDRHTMLHITQINCKTWFIQTLLGSNPVKLCTFKTWTILTSSGLKLMNLLLKTTPLQFNANILQEGEKRSKTT